MEAEDAKRIYPKEYTTWREDPSNFCVDGVYPLQKLWRRAHEAWEEILLTPVGSLYFLIGFFPATKYTDIAHRTSGRARFGCDTQIYFTSIDLHSSWTRTRTVCHNISNDTLSQKSF